MNAPIGGFGGRTSRYNVLSTSAIIIGNIQPGSIIINESSSAVVYFGDSSVSPQTGIALRPGNTCTWQYDGAAYAIVDGTTATEATIVVSNMVSDIDRTTNDTDDGIVLLEKSLIDQDVYHDTYEIRTSPYPSMILELVNLSPGEYESAEVSFIDPPTTYDYAFSTADEPNDTATAYYPVAGQIAHIKVTKSKADNDYILNVWGMKQYVGDKARPTELPPDPPPNFETIDSTIYNGGVVGDINMVLAGNINEFSSIAIELTVTNSGDDGILYEMRAPFSNVIATGRIYDSTTVIKYFPVIQDGITITLKVKDTSTTAYAVLYGSHETGDATALPNDNLEPIAVFEIGGNQTETETVVGMSKYAEYIIEFSTVSTIPDPFVDNYSASSWQTLPGPTPQPGAWPDFDVTVINGYAKMQRAVTGDKLNISVGTTPSDTATTVSVYGLRRPVESTQTNLRGSSLYFAATLDSNKMQSDVDINVIPCPTLCDIGIKVGGFGTIDMDTVSIAFVFMQGSFIMLQYLPPLTPDNTYVDSEDEVYMFIPNVMIPAGTDTLRVTNSGPDIVPGDSLNLDITIVIR